MRHNGFCLFAFTLFPVVAGAQGFPGRDLFEFPLGSVAEGGALSVRSGDGFRNPASVLLPPPVLARLSVSSLTTGRDQGVSGQIAAFMQQAPGGITLGITVARAAVSGIVRTDVDPQPVGGDVPYDALVLSALAARRSTAHVTAGIALRYQRGQLDAHRQKALGIDAGFLVDSVGGLDLRLGAATFLWRPAAGSGEGPAFTGAADVRVAGSDSLAQFRASLSISESPGLSRDVAAGGSIRYGLLEGRAGLVRSSLAGHSATWPRLALGLHYARHFVAIAREEGREGLAPVYHFTLVSTFARRP